MGTLNRGMNWRRVDINFIDRAVTHHPAGKASWSPAGVTAAEIYHRLGQGRICPDQLYLEKVKPRVPEYPRQPADLSVGHVEVVVRDLVGGNIEIPLPVVALFCPEGGLHGKVLVELP